MNLDVASLVEQNRFPDSDGEPISDNTLQAQWIVMMFTNIHAMYHDRRKDVFVAMDHLIYLDSNNPKRRIAPDVYVAYGRPDHHRGSYKLWQENSVFPQVIIEVLSPKNSRSEMAQKRKIYEQYRCEEYIEIEPESERLEVWLRGPRQRKLRPIAVTPEWTSLRLGVRFLQKEGSLELFHPDGRPFRTFEEVQASENHALNRADAAEARESVLRAHLIAMGIDPDTLDPSSPS